MREAIGYTAFLVSMAAVYAGAAEPMLRNVPGFDPGLLAGKICQDTFDTGRRRPPAIRPWSEGALQLRFAANGGCSPRICQLARRSGCIVLRRWAVVGAERPERGAQPLYDTHGQCQDAM